MKTIFTSGSRSKKQKQISESFLLVKRSELSEWTDSLTWFSSGAQRSCSWKSVLCVPRWWRQILCAASCQLCAEVCAAESSNLPYWSRQTIIIPLINNTGSAVMDSDDDNMEEVVEGMARVYTNVAWTCFCRLLGCRAELVCSLIPPRISPPSIDGFPPYTSCQATEARKLGTF